MFNIQGSELIFLLLVALVILGPEKLPDAVRKATKAYSEFKKMANGFQGELRQVLDEPMRELRDTADAVRDAARFDIDLDMGTGPTKSSSSGGGSKPNNNPMERATPGVSKIEPRTGPSSSRDTGLNFGNASAKRQARVARGEEPATDPIAEPATEPVTDAAAAPTTEPAPSAEVAEDANE
ncbi:MAG: Sec-independent protein translocase protein TatB [Actinomycetota bacterium]|nr:Sec-independent protein translocase protein TatB [Actinomycetota bacterium]